MEFLILMAILLVLSLVMSIILHVIKAHKDNRFTDPKNDRVYSDKNGDKRPFEF